MQLSAQLGVSSLSSQSGRVENSKVEPSEFFMIKSSIVLHIYVGLFSFSALSIFQFYNGLACLACRFCPFGIRVSSWRLSNPLGSSCWHERQDAGWSLQDWLALQVNNNNKKPSGWSCEGSLSLPHGGWFARHAESGNSPQNQRYKLKFNHQISSRPWWMYLLWKEDVSKCVSSRRELPFTKTAHLSNPWNEHKPVKIGRDGQVSSCFNFSYYFSF